MNIKLIFYNNLEQIIAENYLTKITVIPSGISKIQCLRNTKLKINNITKNALTLIGSVLKLGF